MTKKQILRKIRFLILEIQRLRGKQPDWIFIHHGGGDWNFYQVNKHHSDKWGLISSLGYGLGYNYWIDKMGLVTHARHDLEEAAHCVGFNKNSIGICLQGNTNITKPTGHQLEALVDLIDKKKIEYDIPNNKVKGHREYSATSCPGDHLWKWLCDNYPDCG